MAHATRLVALVLALALPTLAAAMAPAAPPLKSFDEAIGDTLVGPNPGGAFFLVEWMSENGRPAAAESLRRALWQQQLAYIRGETMDPTLTVRQAIARGAALPPPGPELAAGWQQAYAVSAPIIFRLELPRAFLATQTLPPDVAEPAALKPIEAGLWWQPRERGARYVLAVDLHNNGPATLAPQGLRIRLGSESEGLSFDCLNVPAPTDPRAREREVYAAGQTYALACEAVGPASLRDTLPGLLARARDHTAPAQLLPRPPTDVSAAERAYWKDIRRYRLLKEQWSRQMAFSADATATRRGWVASARPLSPPELAPPPPTGLESVGAVLGIVRNGKPPVLDVMALLPVLGVMALAWLLFVLVRALLRNASSRTQAGAAMVIAALVTLPFAFRAWGGGGLAHGDGWSRLGVLAGGLAVVMLGSWVAMGALLLQALYRVLDADGIGWGGAVAAGWRRMFHFSGPTGRGEFWGFASFAIVLLLLSARLGRPWPEVTALTLMVPLGTLIIRRVTSLTPKEFWLGLAVIVALVADHFVNR